MRTLASARAAPQPCAGRAPLQRKCACAGTGESCSRCASPALQRKSDGGAAEAPMSPLTENILDTPGEPLAPPMRAAMESRFNHDFSDVRLHADRHAAASAQAESAVAFASGSHVVLGDAAMNAGPRSQEALLAHELTHVIQQRRGAHLPGTGDTAALEAEADHAAARVAGGGYIPVQGVAGPGLARSPGMPALQEEIDADSDEDDDELLPGRRSFIGLGHDDRKNPAPAPAPALKPAVAASDDDATPPAPKPPMATTQDDAAPPASKPAAPDSDAAPAPKTGDADGPRPNPFMPHDDAYSIVLGLRAAEDSLPASQIGPAREQLGKLSTPQGKAANTRRINAITRESGRLAREIKKAREAGMPATAPAMQKMVSERAALMNEKRFRQKPASVLSNKLQHAPGGEGASTHTSKTYAIVELADAQGNPLARIVAVNRRLDKNDPADVKARVAAAKLAVKKPAKKSGKGVKAGKTAVKKGAKARDTGPGVHAEEAITIAIEKHINSLKPDEAASFRARLKGGSMHVTVDQEVCAGVCQPRLRTKADDLGLAKVTATTVHAVDPAHHGKPAPTTADLVPAKTTAVSLTDSKAVAKLNIKPEEMATRTETIFQKGQTTLPPPVVARLPPKSAAVIDVDAPHTPAPAPVKAPAPVAHEAPAPKPAPAPVQDAPVAAQPKPAPSAGAPPAAAAPRMPSNAGVVTKLNQADMALNAVRDYQRYKQEYIDAGDSASVAEAKAVARAGVTFGANLKGGKLGQLVNAANAFDQASKTGQSKDEALATTIGTVGGGILANKVAPTGPAGAAVQLINTGAAVLGAPQGVQDATQIAADLVPSSIVSTTLTTGARSWHALGKAATGDLSSIDRLGKDMETGAAGPWIQGYTQWTGIAADMASGDDFSKALDKAAKTGKGSWADRTGSAIADAAFDLGQNKEALAGQYGPVAGGMAVGLNVLAGVARGEDLSTALEKTAKDTAEGQAMRKAKGQQNMAALKKTAGDAVSTVKKETSAALSKAGAAVSSTAAEAEQAVVEKVADVRHQIEPVIDNMVTGASDLAHKTAAVIEHETDAGKKFVSEQAASAKNLARAGWHKLWGD